MDEVMHILNKEMRDADAIAENLIKTHEKQIKQLQIVRYKLDAIIVKTEDFVIE